MSRKINLRGYLPDILKDVKEFCELTAAENPEFDILIEKADVVLENCFIDSLDSYGCGRWENMLAIIPKDTDDLGLRRLRIKAALNGDTPYTMRSLENKLLSLCGAGNYKVSYANDAYTLSVGIALTAKDRFEYIKKLLNEIVPANIIIDAKILYNTHKTVGAYTHGGLSIYTHKNLSEEVLV